MNEFVCSLDFVRFRDQRRHRPAKTNIKTSSDVYLSEEAENKNAPTDIILCQGRTVISIRGATLIYIEHDVHFRDTDISPTTDVCLHVTEYSEPQQDPFFHTLYGPFVK